MWTDDLQCWYSKNSQDKKCLLQLEEKQTFQVHNVIKPLQKTAAANGNYKINVKYSVNLMEIVVNVDDICKIS